jgi:hypothetical protein
VRHEWLLRPGALEVRTHWLGITHTQRYSHGLLWLQPWRPGKDERQALVLQAGRQTRTLAVGEEIQLRELWERVAAHTGWKRRVSREPVSGSTGQGLPFLPAVFLAGGLFVAALGAIEARREADEIRRLRPATMLEIRSSPTGSPALASGTILPGAERTAVPLVVYDAEGYRVEGRGGPLRSPLVSQQPQFGLRLRDGSIAVQRRGELLAPYHTQWVANWRYRGFREGDEATVVGTVAREGRRVSLAAQTIYGGTPAELVRRVQHQGLFVSGVGLTAVVIGALLFRLSHI